MSLVQAFVFHGIKSADEAGDLEQQIKCEAGENPSELRARLLGFYLGSGSRTQRQDELLAEHLEALIEAAPEQSFLGLRPPLDEVLLNRLRRAWGRQLEARRSSAAVAANAARFMMSENRQEALALYHRACSLESDNFQWPREIAFSCLRALPSSRSGERDWLLQEALGALEAAAAAAADDEDSRLLLNLRAEAYVAAAEWSEAEEYAKEAVNAAYADDWYDGHLLHTGHLVLGVVALHRQDGEQALAHLNAALEVPDTPQFQTGWPSRILLAEYERAGYGKAVASFLKRWDDRFGK